MSSALSFLVDWGIRYLENKDVVRKEILSIEERRENGFRIKYKSGVRQFFVMGEFDQSVLNLAADNEQTGFIILNNIVNVDAFIKYWSIIAQKKKLMYYFVNPLSNSDKAWVINPYVHNRVCDPESLELGIRAMSEMVEAISWLQFEKKLEREQE